MRWRTHYSIIITRSGLSLVPYQMAEFDPLDCPTFLTAPKIGERKPLTEKQKRAKCKKIKAQRRARRVQRLTPNPKPCQKKRPHVTPFQKKLIRWLLEGSTLHGRMWPRGPSYYVRSPSVNNPQYTTVTVATIASLLNKGVIFVAMQSEDKIKYNITEACARYCRKHFFKTDKI